LRFLDEADAINSYIPELKKKGVRAIVVLIHQGGRQSGNVVTGPDILDIINRLDDEVDIVVSGHAHSFTNTLLPNQNGKEILVTQAFSASTAYADIDLELDRATGDVIAKTASIITTFADAGPGLTPDAKAAQLTKAAEEKVAPLVNQVIGVAQNDILDDQNSAGESALGNLIADAQRAAMGTDFAFMNPGGIRADISGGDVTWGDLFTVQPFGNSLVKVELTGQQIYNLLNQQWAGQPFPRILQVSGLTYTWDNNLPAASRIVEIRKDGALIALDAIYTVTANSFIAAGGDNFTVFTQGANPVGGPIDLDALIAYLKGLPQPFAAAIEGRITRLN
jgi:5'-nucleotidase